MMLYNPKNRKRIYEDISGILEKDEYMINACAEEIPDCNIHTVYSNLRLNIDNSRIISALKIKQEKERRKLMQPGQQKAGSYDPVAAILEYIPKSIKQPDDYIYSNAPALLKDIIQSQLKEIEQKYNRYAAEEEKEIRDNYGKGIRSWIVRNIVNPITGILYSFVSGNILTSG